MDKTLYLIELFESPHTAYGRVDFSAQPLPQRVFSAIWALESQVNNNGFAQFVAREDAALVAFAPEALRSIGALRCAEIVARATSVAAAPADTGRAAALDELDGQFYTYPDDLAELLYRFVQAHPASFGTPAAPV